MIYSKIPKSIEQQISLLKERGMYFEDEQRAKHYLENISYYRLAGYWWPMQSNKTNHLFKDNTQFSKVIELYNFDRKLRILVFDIIEKIEISLRTKMIYHLSMAHTPWWFQDTGLFSNTQELIKTLAKFQEEIERSKDTFIKSHKKQYKEDKRFPPAWKTLELTSLGGLSRLYGNIRNDVKAKNNIAVAFGAVNHTYLPSWLQSISQIRNYCAHHSRLWNRNLPGKPKLLSNPPNKWINAVPKESEFQKLYIHLCLMKYLVNQIQPDNSFTSRLKELFSSHPNVDPLALGMKENWEQEALWH